MAGPNPYAQYAQPNPYVVYSTQGAGAKPPSGFSDPTTASRIVATPGGPQDLKTISDETRARDTTSTAIHEASERRLMQERAAIERQTWLQQHPEMSAPPQLSSGLTGADLLKSLSPRDAATVHALTDGRMAFPAGAAIRSPYWQNMLGLVAQYDPQFDAVNYNARAKTRQDFTSGQSARNIKALNTAIGHLGQLNTQLGGTASHGGFPFATTVNTLENAYLRGKGDTGPTLFDQTSGALASELTQVFRGTGGAEADVKRYLSEMSPNASMDQKKAAVANIAGLLRSRLEAIGDQYRQGMGKTVDPLTLLNPHAQQAFQAILPGSDDGSAPTSVGGAPGPGPQGGGTPPAAPGGNAQGGAPIPLYDNSPPPAATLAAGPTHTVRQRNPVMDMVGQMANGGASGDQIRAFLTKSGIDPTTVNGIDAAVQFHQRYPNTKSDAYTDRVVPSSPINQFMGSRKGALMGSAADGFTAGLTDEFTGGMNSLITGDPLGQSIAAANAGKQAAFDTYPGASMLGGAGGNIAGTLLGGALLKGTGVAAGLGKYAPAAGDVAFNAASGAGQSNDNRLLGAGLGAGLGVAGQYAGQLASIPAGAVARSAPVASAVDFGRRMFGADPLSRAPALSSAQQAAVAAIGKADPAAVNASLNEASGLGLPMTLADTHPELRELAGAAVRRSPTAADVAENVLIPRNRGQIDRLSSAVNRDLGPTTNIPQTSADLTAQARTAAGPLYDQAYAAPGASSVKLDDIINRPLSMRPGIARAKTIAEEEGRDPTALGFDLTDQGEVTLNRVPSYQTLDYVKRGLDDILEPHRNDLTGKLALNEATRAINGTKNTLLGRIDARNPAYKAARDAYAGPTSARDALARGQDAYSLSPDQLGMQMGGQTPEHADQMRLGFRGALMDAANRLRYSSNPYDATLGTRDAEQRLGAMFANDPNANVPQLLRQRDIERQMQNTSNSILGNSKTAQRSLADQAFSDENLGQALDIGVNLATGQVPTGVVLKGLASSRLRDAVKFGMGQRAVSKADELAPMLLNPDAAANSNTIDDLLSGAALRRAYIEQSRPKRALGMFGRGLGVSSVNYLTN